MNGVPWLPCLTRQESLSGMQDGLSPRRFLATVADPLRYS
jgi:hypothetical protein